MVIQEEKYKIMRKAFFHSAQGFPGQSNTNIENVQVNIQI
jgi:hypothetical protein